jgi:hypothetical protein
MIKEIVLKRNKLIATLDKKQIIKSIMASLPGLKMAFMYFGGSVCYGTFISGKSDYDINVVVDDLKGAFKTNISGTDVFIYGVSSILDRLNPNSPISQYKRSFIDDVLGLPDTLIGLNEEYKDIYEEYKNFDFNKNLKGFLTNFYEYFAFCFNGEFQVGKKFYHVIRMRGQIENYKKTGVFSLDLPKSYFDEEIDYKLNWNNENRRKELNAKLEKYLDEIYEFKEGLKDG